MKDVLGRQSVNVAGRELVSKGRFEAGTYEGTMLRLCQYFHREYGDSRESRVKGAMFFAIYRHLLDNIGRYDQGLLAVSGSLESGALVSTRLAKAVQTHTLHGKIVPQLVAHTQGGFSHRSPRTSWVSFHFGNLRVKSCRLIADRLRVAACRYL